MADTVIYNRIHYYDSVVNKIIPQLFYFTSFFFHAERVSFIIIVRLKRIRI